MVCLRLFFQVWRWGKHDTKRTALCKPGKDHFLTLKGSLWEVIFHVKRGGEKDDLKAAELAKGFTPPPRYKNAP